MDPQSRQETKYKAKAIMGILSDKVDVGMAKIRGEESGALDVAMVKATLNDEVVPKEKHVRTLKIACSGSAPRQQVNYVIHGLNKRLEEAKSGWLVTLKTLIVYHRLMREVDPTFQEEVLRYADRTGARRLLRLDGFADHTTKDTWDYSAWVRVYSVYLDERLALFRAMKFDPVVYEQEAGREGGGASGGRDSGLKACSTPELLEKLPQVQRLLGRLVACVPEGAAQRNKITVNACSMVLKELRAIYKVVCEGVMNLADKFFEMERQDAQKGLELYKENVALNERLNGYFTAIGNVPDLRGAVQFPTLQSLPSDFLTTLEEYVKDAPRTMDPSAPAPRGSKPADVPPPAAMRSSTIARQGATTSAAIAGGAAPPAPTINAGNPGVLKIGGPVSSAPAAPSPATEVDLLGADLDSLVVSPTSAAQPTVSSGSAAASPAPAGAPLPFEPNFGAAPLQQQQQGVFSPPTPVGQPQVQQQQQAMFGMPPPYGGMGVSSPPAAAAPAPAAPVNPFGESVFGVTAPAPAPTVVVPPPITAPAPVPFPAFADNAFGAPSPASSAATPAPTPGAMPPQQAFNPFGSPSQPQMPPPMMQQPMQPMAPMMQQPMQAMGNPFGSPGGPAAPAPAPMGQHNMNPFGAPMPMYGAPMGGAPAPAPAPMMMGAPQPAAAGSNPFAANPFGASGPSWPAPAPAAAPAPQSFTPPGAGPKPKVADPLSDLSMDLFGKQAVQPAPPPSLKDMKAGGSLI